MSDGTVDSFIGKDYILSEWKEVLSNTDMRERKRTDYIRMLESKQKEDRMWRCCKKLSERLGVDVWQVVAILHHYKIQDMREWEGTRHVFNKGLRYLDEKPEEIPYIDG